MSTDLPYRNLFQRGLWNDLLVTYSKEELTYASRTVPGLTVRVPRANGRWAYLRNYDVLVDLMKLATMGEVHRVEWRFQSLVCFDTIAGIRHFLKRLCLSGKTERIVIDVSNMGDYFHSEAILLRKMGEIEFHGRMVIRCRSVARDAAPYKNLRALGSSRFLQGNIDLEVEISHSSGTPWQELVSLGPMLRSIAIDHVFLPGEVDRLEWFLEHIQDARQDLKVIIKDFAVKGESAIRLARGSISLSIESIRRDSSIDLSCSEKLECLIVTAEAAECLTGRELKVDLLCVAQVPSPSAGVLARIKAQFAHVSAAVKLED